MQERYVFYYSLRGLSAMALRFLPEGMDTADFAVIRNGIRVGGSKAAFLCNPLERQIENGSLNK